MSSYLLDTNIVIAALNGEPAIVGQLQSVSSLYLSVITVGELLRGARGSARAELNLARIRSLVKALAVLPCDAATAEQYGSIGDRLRREGRPIPQNDLWIAATACQHRLVLVTRDRHFASIESLQQTQW